MRDFRETLQQSNPRYSPDGLKFMTVKSAALRGRGDICLWLPENLDTIETLPLVILLHGVYGSHWAWALCGGAHITARRLIDNGEIQPMALVMPSDGLWGDGSGYLPHAEQDFDIWITEDVPEAVRAILPERLTRNLPLCIAGLSMGGFGALRLAAKHGKKKFTAASGHSSVTSSSQMEIFVEEPLHHFENHQDDPDVLGTMLKNRDSLPTFRFDCGSEDILIEHNRTLHHELEVNGVEHVYQEFSGGHEWPYWELHLEDTLRFFDQVLARG